MTTEPATPDLDALRRSLGLPPSGIRLDRAQALCLLRALGADREPISEEVRTWTQRVLGVRADT